MMPEEFKSKVFGWAGIIKVKPKEIHFRKMKNKLASCSSKGRITFDKSVLECDEAKTDEIIVHELLHLRYPVHNKMFHVALKMYLNNK